MVWLLPSAGSGARREREGESRRERARERAGTRARSRARAREREEIKGATGVRCRVPARSFFDTCASVHTSGMPVCL